MLRFTTSSEWRVASVFSELQQSAAGETLFRQDDDPRSVAFVLDGWVKTIRLEQNGEEKCVALYRHGALLGLEEMIAEQKRAETAITLSLSRLCWISARDFFRLIETDPGFSRRIFCALGRQDYARGICLAQRGGLSLRPRLEQLIWI